MPKVTRDFLHTDFGQMHVRLAQPAQPSNRPLLCLHMAPQSGRDFEDFMFKASQDRLVIAPDYHGYGESDVPPEAPEVTISDYANTLWQAIDILGLDEIDILGHHTGSKVAIEMGRQYPNRVASLTLISISMAVSENVSVPSKTFSPLPLDEAGEGLNNWWKTMRTFYGDDVSLDSLLKQYAESLRAGPAFHWGFRAASAYNAELVKNVTPLEIPITVICPGDDLENITPTIMPHLKNGTFVDKSNWQHGFLSLHTNDAVQTVLESIDKMNAKPRLKQKAS